MSGAPQRNGGGGYEGMHEDFGDVPSVEELHPDIEDQEEVWRLLAEEDAEQDQK